MTKRVSTVGTEAFKDAWWTFGIIHLMTRLFVTPPTLYKWKRAGTVPKFIDLAAKRLLARKGGETFDMLPAGSLKALAKNRGFERVCDDLGISRATFYRRDSQPIRGALMLAIKQLREEGNE